MHRHRTSCEQYFSYNVIPLVNAKDSVKSLSRQSAAWIGTSTFVAVPRPIYPDQHVRRALFFRVELMQVWAQHVAFPAYGSWDESGKWANGPDRKMENGKQNPSSVSVFQTQKLLVANVWAVLHGDCFSIAVFFTNTTGSWKTGTPEAFAPSRATAKTTASTSTSHLACRSGLGLTVPCDYAVIRLWSEPFSWREKQLYNKR